MQFGNDIVDIASESLAKIRPLARLFFLLLFSVVNACSVFVTRYYAEPL